MDRRLGLWVSAVGGLLAVTLVVAPVWDFWRYRSLRAPLGPHVPIGVILPMRSVPPPLPARAPDTPAAPRRAAIVPAAEPRDVPAPAATPWRAVASTPQPGSPVAARAVVERPAPASHAPPSTLPTVTAPRAAAFMAPPSPPPLPAETHAGGDPSPAPQGIGWIAAPVVPAPTAPPSPEADPEPATPKPNTPVTHGPGGGSSRPDPRENPTLALVLPSTPITVGDAVNVTVHLSDASNVSSVPFHVEFDPAVLEFQSASQGPGVASMQPILLANVNPARPGDLAVGLSLVESSGLLQGSGAVIRLQFRAVAPGVSPLDFSRASVRGRTGEALDARFQNASVEVH
ncbi:MAG TPA: cohesin domain-containing protein [Candidatus Polarisedimenticolia bacterium]|nr:cohesin domain-containing protein [Candidatus Polarisedimenticolia bacterium]